MRINTIKENLLSHSGRRAIEINSCLRRIFNIFSGLSRRIRNEELWQRGKQQPIGEQILRRKWGWIGHTLRKAPNNITRQHPKERERGDAPETAGDGTLMQN